MGRPPFLLSEIRVYRYAKPGVNALNGATSISTETELAVIEKNEMCQCPEWGDLHFYEDLQSELEYVMECVNALNGATSISTLASGNPHK